MTKLKRREKIVKGIIETIDGRKRNNFIISKETLIAVTCMEFYCGENLVKEILKHLVLTDKIPKIYSGKKGEKL